MKISEIKDPELRALALKRHLQKPLKLFGVYPDGDIDLMQAFGFRNTPERYSFWYDVNNGKITSLHPTDPCASDYVMD